MPTADRAVIAHALNIIRRELRVPGAAISSPQHVKDFLTIELALEDREVFGVVFLDSQHAVIAFERLFYGTLNQTSVYPREVARRALQLNAAAVILSHNHPSGRCEPSHADERLTQEIKGALALLDIRVLDHVVVGGTATCSFAERGLL
jgi:DNA repair protein RadC